MIYLCSGYLLYMTSKHVKEYTEMQRGIQHANSIRMYVMVRDAHTIIPMCFRKQISLSAEFNTSGIQYKTPPQQL